MVASLKGHDDAAEGPGLRRTPSSPTTPRTTSARRKAEILVLIGICTHLGCLPKQHFDAGDPELGADWPGGFFCPCHGSRFDLAGRVFDGSPASVNLRIPPYSFPNDRTRLVVGVDEKGEA